MNPIEKGQLASTTVQCLSAGVGAISQFPRLLKRIIVEQVWAWRIHRGREYKLGSLRELITAKVPTGWGEDPDKIEAIIKDDAEVLAMYERAMQLKPGPKPKTETNSVDNVNQTNASKGNSKAYTVSRLKRESPELFQQVVAGELSANAAAIKAGWRKKKTPLEIITALIPKLSADERAKLSAMLTCNAQPLQ